MSSVGFRVAPLSLFTCLAIGAAAGSARAEQFVLFQQTFDITKAAVDRSGSHFYVRGPMLTQPPGNNWTAPIDYRNGDVHIQTEVLEKPASGEQNHWSYCYMPNRPIGPGYGCAGSGRYTATGVYQHVEKMTAWWQNTAISWPQGIKEMHLVIKGIGDSGHLHKRSDVDKLFPTKVRIMMVQVSAGATFDPSKAPGWVMKPADDGGAPAPSGDGGAAPDASGTGGTGGGSGAGGTGGSSGGGGTEGGAGGQGGTAGTGASGGAAGSGGASAGAGGSAPPAGSGGTSGSTGSAGSRGTPPADPSTGGAGGRSNGGPRGPVSGGCTVAGEGGAGGWALAVFGAWAWALGRRSRRAGRS